MKITIDRHAGFCSGVRKAIEKAEEVLKMDGHLYCLGQIVEGELEQSCPYGQASNSVGGLGSSERRAAGMVGACEGWG